jgi:hypothetical protein
MENKRVDSSPAKQDLREERKGRLFWGQGWGKVTGGHSSDKYDWLPRVLQEEHVFPQEKA